ncbi:MAG: dTDP-4-dehydrorhamnose 3,5-epimerase [Bacilli bacterium]
MGKFTRIDTKIKGVYVIEPTVFGDDRGYFFETYTKKDFEEIGIDYEFVQDNQSKSKKGVLRGLHFQTKNSQGKLVRVLKGEVLDVVVDLRENSDTFGKWESVLLSDQNKKMFFLPPGMAHGFVVFSDEAEFAYKCTDYYNPSFESGLLWNDPDIAVDWQLDKLDADILLSDKDSKWLGIKNYIKNKDELK